jgi:hypothetical protein
MVSTCRERQRVICTQSENAWRLRTAGLPASVRLLLGARPQASSIAYPRRVQGPFVEMLQLNRTSTTCVWLLRSPRRHTRTMRCQLVLFWLYEMDQKLTHRT